MKIGDLVRLSSDDWSDITFFTGLNQQAWVIVALKSDSKGIWIQFEETSYDTWHSASYYEVVE